MEFNAQIASALGTGRAARQQWSRSDMEPDVLERDTADVVIIGGGAVGCATAYALTHAASAPERVIIIERDPSYRESSTPRSAG